MNTHHWTSRKCAVVAPTRQKDVVVEDIDGEIVLCDRRNGKTYRLNETACAVWRCCDGRTTTRQIAGELTKDYKVDFDRALDDTEQVLVYIATAGLTTLEVVK